jgi:hypothetical protein
MPNAVVDVVLRALPDVVLACPDCAPSRAARSAVARDPSFFLHLLAVSLPILVITAIAAVLYVVGNRRPSTASETRR